MKLLFALPFLVLSVTASAESSHRLGFGVGTPFVAEGMYEYWGGETPLVFRGHLGTIGFVSSAALDFGMIVDGEGDFQQFVGISAEGVEAFWGLGTTVYGCAGPKYGMRYKGWYADAGVGFGGGSGTFIGLQTSLSINVFPMFHAGYAFEI